MYFVDRNKIEQTLTYLDELQLQFLNQSSWEQPIEKLALERIVQQIIESIIDVGNAMIDGFIMRDPGSYEDIIEILLDEKVVTAEQAKGLKELVLFRKELVQEYLEVNHANLIHALKEHSEEVKQFPAAIRRYLEEELGPVSAFKA